MFHGAGAWTAITATTTITVRYSPPTQQAPWTLDWIHRWEYLVVCVPSGMGKSFFLEALGQQAVEQGLRLVWLRHENLGQLIRAHRTDGTIKRAINRGPCAGLVMVEKVGLLTVGADATEGLSRVVDAAYSKRSIAISSKLHPAKPQLPDQRRHRQADPVPRRERGDTTEPKHRNRMATCEPGFAGRKPQL